MSYEPKHVREWFIFGRSPDDPNLVDISDGDEDILTRVPKETAEVICRLRYDHVRRNYPEYHWRAPE